ncbi:hypothetical protein PFICI_13942 [Pestalotiopsis fici W106-1]|uniref:Orc1-like AAA ATPase domain-containing protein n=1 Tax=Pestalotiopsis fici (strain W106-1 / CGMCC3.15140) TaxID=1229662 RepID=W3WMN0_PESFW|nr:uncharacterized protein PFICI_13942 [Pestalotiopsis fici W106-1]ETS74076.1 hypothetical protein PFICI_13942 [Pestalotiopsis fici W106-1]
MAIDSFSHDHVPQRAQACPAIHFPRNNDFVGRDAQLAQLKESLLRSQTDKSMVAIHGLGGIGKTQLALEFARSADESCSVFWVPARTETSFSQAYKSIATLLGLAGNQDVLSKATKHTSQRLKNNLQYQAWIDNSLVATTYPKQPKERSILPVLINGKHFDGFPDTNATRNVMTEEFAVSIGAVIDRATAGRATFINAIGEKTSSIGQTSLEVAFPDNPGKSWSCQFQVVRCCPEGLVFGDHFLRTLTETLTKFRHRLKKKATVSGLNIRRLLHMETPRQQLRCSINSQGTLANMDTGSDIDLVSLKFAESCGLDISYFPHNEGFVKLSNGTVKKLLGYSDNRLNLGEDLREKRFFVLDGLVADVVLGDDTLEDLDVFNKHVDSFVDQDDFIEADNFHMIEWRERYDSVERNVETLLRAAEGVPAAEEPSLRRRFAHVLRHGPNNARTSRPVKCDVQLRLRRTLEDLDRLEDHLDDQSHRRLEKVRGDDVLREQQSNELRKRQYQYLRTKILGGLQNFDKIEKG